MLPLQPVITSYSIHYTKLYDRVFERGAEDRECGQFADEHFVGDTVPVRVDAVTDSLHRLHAEMEHHRALAEVANRRRITSYNVCYTKLLRASFAAEAIQFDATDNDALARIAPQPGPAGGRRCDVRSRTDGRHLRITSYNVCYTKLLRKPIMSHPDQLLYQKVVFSRVLMAVKTGQV